MNDTSEQLPECFFICPIGKEGTAVRSRSDFVSSRIVEPALAGLYNFVRADRMSESGRIDGQILRAIITAELVIVDLTDSNPNVYFEFGIRFALARKPFLCICDKNQIESLPFDVRQLRVIPLPMALDRYEGFPTRLMEDLEFARSSLRDAANPPSGQTLPFTSPLAEQGVVLDHVKPSTTDHEILMRILRGVEELLREKGSLPLDVSQISGFRAMLEEVHRKDIQDLLYEVLEAVNADGGFVGFRDSRNFMQIVASKGKYWHLPADAGFTGQVFVSAEPAIVDPKEAAFEDSPDIALSEMAAPILVSGSAEGVILADRYVPIRFNSSELETLVEYAGKVGDLFPETEPGAGRPEESSG